MPTTGVAKWISRRCRKKCTMCVMDVLWMANSISQLSFWLVSLVYLMLYRDSYTYFGCVSRSGPLVTVYSCRLGPLSAAVATRISPACWSPNFFEQKPRVPIEKGLGCRCRKTKQIAKAHHPSAAKNWQQLVNRVSRVASSRLRQPCRFVEHRSWSKKAMTYARISWGPDKSCFFRFGVGPTRAKLLSWWGDCQFRKMIWQKCLQRLHDIACMNWQLVDLLNSQRGLNISQWFLMNKMMPVTRYHCHDCAMFSANPPPPGILCSSWDILPHVSRL